MRASSPSNLESALVLLAQAKLLLNRHVVRAKDLPPGAFQGLMESSRKIQDLIEEIQRHA
jgi:hypothetical protein